MDTANMLYIKISAIEEGEAFSAFYIELDEQRIEVRAIEVGWDGSITPLSRDLKRPGKGLSTEPMPTIDEINDGGHYEAEEISKDEFDRLWQQAVA